MGTMPTLDVSTCCKMVFKLCRSSGMLPLALLLALAGGPSAAQTAAGDAPAPADSKEAKPEIDATSRAFGAFQRGYYLTAMELALPRAQLGDPAAQCSAGARGGFQSSWRLNTAHRPSA